MTGLQRANEFATGHDIADRERREDGLVAREDAAGVGDGEDILIDDKAGKVHDAIRGCVDRPGGRDVDAAVSRSVWSRRCNERTKDLVGAAHRPGPARLGRGGGRSDCEAADREGNEKREAKHPLIVVKPSRPGDAAARVAHNPAEMRPVGERCYPYRSIQHHRMTTRVRYFLNEVHTTTQSHSIRSLSLSEWRGRVRAPGFAPNGADNN